MQMKLIAINENHRSIQTILHPAIDIVCRLAIATRNAGEIRSSLLDPMFLQLQPRIFYLNHLISYDSISSDSKIDRFHM